MLGAAVYFDEITIGARALAVVVFIFVTAPVAAHMLGRAAYVSGVPLWEGTLSDDLKGRYHAKTHSLASGPVEPVLAAQMPAIAGDADPASGPLGSGQADESPKDR
jgi:multicomponent Na+:H+ antiporter subunit G